MLSTRKSAGTRRSMSVSPAAPPPKPTPAKPRWRRWLVDIALIVLVVTGVQLWQSRNVPAGLAPDFDAVMVDGSSTRLDDWRRTHPGQAVGLYFWAEWCPVCSAQQGSVDAVRSDYPVLTVAMQSGDAAAVKRYLNEQQLDWVTAIDADGGIAAQYGLRGVPALITIAPDGQIRSVAIGYTTEIGMRLRLWWAGFGL